jgi:hypothetical protein
MAKLIFYGWRTGMQKIPFIHLLKDKGGLTLSEAKKMKDRLVNNDEIIELIIEDELLAKEILQDALKLKVKAKME